MNLRRALLASILLLFGVRASAQPVIEPGVLMGAGLVSKRVIHTSADLAPISSIAKDGERLHVVGRQGAAVVAGDGTSSIIRFDRSGGDIVAADIDGDGHFEYVNRGGGWQPVSLISSDGKTKWRYPQSDSLFGHAADTMSFADLDGDGTVEFLVGMNGGGGVVVLDANGAVKRRFEGRNVFSVAAADLVRGGRPELIHSDGGQIAVRAGNGRLLRKLTLPSSSFTLLDNEQGVTFVSAGVEELRLIDTSGIVKTRLSLPDRGHVTARAARLPHGRIAAWRTLQARGRRSALYLFAADGTLIWHEVFATPAITVLADGAAFYVGANDTVWRYALDKP